MDFLRGGRLCTFFILHYKRLQRTFATFLKIVSILIFYIPLFNFHLKQPTVYTLEWVWASHLAFQFVECNIYPYISKEVGDFELQEFFRKEERNTYFLHYQKVTIKVQIIFTPFHSCPRWPVQRTIKF